MMQYYGDIRLSQHAIKAYAYAQGIGIGEGLSDKDMLILSSAAILHDIGIPQAIKLHGSAKGEHQEREGALLVPEMLEYAGLCATDVIERVTWLVGHHHTASLSDSDILLQILMEADYLVNLAEGNRPIEMAQEIRDTFFKTDTGKEYISALFAIK